MKKRPAGQPLPFTKLKAKGHRSSVSGPRLLHGKKAGPIKDALAQDAADMFLRYKSQP